MDKSARKYFERLMSEHVAQAAAVHERVVAILASEHGIPESHFEHGGEIAAAVCQSIPNIVTDTALLEQMGEDDAAHEAVRAAVEAVKNTDPSLFAPAVSVKLLARWQTGPSPSRDIWTQYVSAADYMSVDQRRRAALSIRRDALARGVQLPDESSVAGLLNRDQAIADQHARGSGARQSARHQGRNAHAHE
jgi:hypothetical protein